MKSEIFNGSIKAGSQELYTTANNSKVSAPHGAFIKISNNETSYKIEDVKTLTIKRRFEVLNSSTLRIKGNFEYKITPQDEISLYYDKHQASSVDKILKQEGSYRKGETLYCQGGVVSSSTENLTGKMCEIEIVSVDDEGKALKTKMNAGGVYNSPPSNPVIAINEKEKPITLNLTFDILDDSNVTGRTVSSVNSSSTHSDLTLSYDIPKGVQEGEIILIKQIIVLDREYSHEGIYSEICSIIKDFSPSLRFPLMAPNSPTAHTIFNTAIEMVEEKFKAMEERIKRLEKSKR